jgi:hypothetical protein
MAQPSTANRAGPAEPPPPRLFPPSFNIYAPCHLESTGAYWIGEHRQPRLRALRLVHRWEPLDAYTAVVLYATPREPLPLNQAAGAMAWANWWAAQNRFIITLNDGTKGGGVAGGNRNEEVVLQMVHRGCQFSRWKDTFEWRYTEAPDVIRALPGRPSWARSLVRLTGPGSGTDQGATRDSDGREVLAAWCVNQRWTKERSFRFFGQGVSGELGPWWELMAVMSGLCTMADHRRRKYELESRELDIRLERMAAMAEYRAEQEKYRVRLNT